MPVPASSATRINDTSVGIELLNRGYTRTLTGRDWQPFTPAQIAALTALLRDVAQRYAIAPQRKQDPGPLFP
ncbi:N-acetylmuramoyl-L-alanine amidase|nr:N-acetylmuramoyl-L-alanine amidase [Candidatus Pantoea persica]